MMHQHNYEIGIDDHGDVYDIVIRDSGNIIAVLSSGEAPAEHLVRAGNCHDELLEAAKAYLAWDDEDLSPDSYGYEKRKALSTAIAKAGGGQGIT